MEGPTDELTRIEGVLDLLEDRAFLEQSQVVMGAARVPIEERQQQSDLIRTCLSSSKDPHRMVRGAQIAVGWLPESLGTVLSALESGDREIRFAILCALIDASESSLTLLQNHLAWAVWRSMITSRSHSVEFIGSELLLEFDSSLVHFLIAETKGKTISPYLIHRLRDNGIWFKKEKRKQKLTHQIKELIREVKDRQKLIRQRWPGRPTM